MPTAERCGAPRRALAAGALAVALAAVPARAAPDERVEVELSIGAAPLQGGVRGESYAVPIGAAALVRAGAFRIGPTFTLSVADGAVQERSLYLGLALGRTIDLADAWRLALLGEAGLHHVFEVWESRYSNGDAGFFPDWVMAQRRNVDLPYLGARAGVTWEQRHDRSLGGLWSRAYGVGVFAFVRGDLARGTATVDYAPFGLGFCFGPCPPPATARYAVGGVSAGVGFEVSARW